ncbi:MAG: SMC-Scp complex subunit ScpB [bacterium]
MADAKTKTKAPAEPQYSRAESKRLLEAILFAADKPVPAAQLGSLLSGSPEAAVREALGELGRDYEESGRSFVLKEVGGGFLLLTHPAFEPWVRKLFRQRLTLRLSKSALETVAIIAYRQPVSKMEIETIRGVNADGVLNTLLERKLVKVVGRKEGMGRALLYGTTNEFLIYLGLNDLADLPQLDEMKAILESKEKVPGAGGVPPAPATAAPAEAAATGPEATPPAGTPAEADPNVAAAEAPVAPTAEREDEEADEDDDEDDEDDDDEDETDEEGGGGPKGVSSSS